MRYMDFLDALNQFDAEDQLEQQGGSTTSTTVTVTVQKTRPTLKRGGVPQLLTYPFSLVFS